MRVPQGIGCWDEVWSSGRQNYWHPRVGRLTDVLIAITAVVYGLLVLTEDEEFDQSAAVHPLLRVIKA